METLEVEFDDGKWVTYSFKQLDELELAYAVTIHVLKWGASSSFMVIDQFSQHHLLKSLSFLRCIFLPPLSKIRCP